MKRIVACALICALSFSLAACGAKEPEVDESSSASSGTRTIQAAVVFAQDDAYAAQMLAGAEAAIAEAGSDIALDVSYSEGSKVKERATLSSLNLQNVQGVLCFPVSSDESVAELNRVSERGFSVAILGASSAGTSFACASLAYDPYALGKAAGQAARTYIETTFSGKAKIAVIHHNAANQVESMLRQNGFLDSFDGLSDVSVVATLDLSSSEGSADRMVAFLKDHTDIDVIFCTTGEGLATVHSAVTAAKYKAALFGVDAHQGVVDILRSPDNTIQAVVAQDYYEMGRSAMAALIEAMSRRGQALSPVELAPILLTPGDETALQNFESRLG